jgi:hypothetical protein
VVEQHFEVGRNIHWGSGRSSVKFGNLDGWTSGKASERDLLNGLSRRERTFVLEKIVGRNDKDAALAAG